MDRVRTVPSMAAVAASEYEPLTGAGPGANAPLVPRKVALDIGGSPNIYTAVIAATFAGVKLRAPARPTRVHPVVLLALCVPCFSAQMSALFFVQQGLDFRKDVYTPGDAHSEALLTLKVVLIAVFFLSNFEHMVSRLRNFAFLVNPITWCECEVFQTSRGSVFTTIAKSVRIIVSEDRLAWIIDGAIVFPCAFIAIGMGACVVYFTSFNSISIILSADNAMDAIFNSLAITFIIDLGSQWWFFCKITLCFADTEDAQVTLLHAGDVWTEEGEFTPEFLKVCVFPRLHRWVVQLTTLRTQKHNQSFLRAGFGAGAIRQVTALFILCLICLRQLYKLVAAIDSNMLGVGRGLCKQRDFMNTAPGLSSADWLNSKLWNALDRVWILSANAGLHRLEETKDLRTFCSDLEPLPSVFDLTGTYLGSIAVVVIVMVAVVVVPTLVVDLLAVAEDVALEEVDNPTSQMDELRARVQALEEHSKAA